MTYYTIVTADNPDSLVELVRGAICAGWKPLGGVSVAHAATQDFYNSRDEREEGLNILTYAQALTRSTP